MSKAITNLIAEARETRGAMDHHNVMRLADACEQLQARISELEFNAAEHQRLMGELNAILHPDGDGPANPSTCDLVAFVQELASEVEEPCPKCNK